MKKRDLVSLFLFSFLNYFYFFKNILPTEPIIFTNVINLLRNM